MMRLVKHGLMFGNLFEVTSPTLVARYNRALEHLTSKKTKLKEFHIDISGYSPEIGDELNDQTYLNPNGCNRQFILLSTAQKTAPLLNAQFSTSHTILREFIDRNEEQLFSLTSREAVAGELVNSIYSLENPADLFAIREVEIEADTVEAHVAASEILSGKIDKFMKKPDAWWDDVLTAEMIELAKRTGDITRHPVKLGHKHFEQGNFYTTHFGGLYVFREMDKPACIAFGDKNQFATVPIDNVLDSDARNEIASFLRQNDLVEPVLAARTGDPAFVLKQKLDFIVVDTAASVGEDLSNTTRRDLRQLRRKLINDFPPEYHGLSDLWRWSTSQGAKPIIRPDHPAYFYTLRSSHHRDKYLVNMLLANLTPLDFRQLFICHKAAFYRSYRRWSDQKKDYVVKFLETEYLMDKAGARRDLFGPEPGMFDDEFGPIELDIKDGATAVTEEDESAWTRKKQRRGPWGPIPN